MATMQVENHGQTAAVVPPLAATDSYPLSTHLGGFMTTSRTGRIRLARGTLAATASLALVASAALSLANGADAATSSKGFIAVPTGMVGVQENITISAPSAKGQVVTLGLQAPTGAINLQTVIGSNGYGSVEWTPTVAGSWSVNGLVVIASLGSVPVTVNAMPTYTILLAQNALQAGVNNNLQGAVVAPIGSIAPTGNVYLATAGGNGISTVPLSGQLGSTIATANLPWNPGTTGPASIQAQFLPDSTAFTSSTSPISQPNVTSALSVVALRWPARLFVGTPTVLQAVLGANIPDGSAAFAIDGVAIGGSTPTTNGVATRQWTPTASGVHTISVQFSSNTGAFSGVSSQQVNILTNRLNDTITVVPKGQPVWSIASPIYMTAGTSLLLAGNSASGNPLIFSENGPCVISGAALTALSAGQCEVTAQSVGNATLAPTTATYTVTVKSAPAPKPAKKH